MRGYSRGREYGWIDRYFIHPAIPTAVAGMTLASIVKHRRRVVRKISIELGPANPQGRLRVGQPSGGGSTAGLRANLHPVGVEIHGRTVIGGDDMLPRARRGQPDIWLQVHGIPAGQAKAEIPFALIVAIEQETRPVCATEPILVKTGERGETYAVSAKRIGLG